LNTPLERTTKANRKEIKLKITTVNEAIRQDYSRPNVVIETDPPRTFYLTEAGVEEDQVSEIAFDNLRDNQLQIIAHQINFETMLMYTETCIVKFDTSLVTL
jgi:hypothetical protein